jgi:hypothetical protein
MDLSTKIEFDSKKTAFSFFGCGSFMAVPVSSKVAEASVPGR